MEQSSPQTQHKISRFEKMVRDLNSQGRLELESSVKTTSLFGVALVFGSFVGAGFVSKNLHMIGLQRFSQYRKTAFMSSFLAMSFGMNVPLALYQEGRYKEILNNPLYKNA
jgi:hypothetical protein